MGTQSSLGDSSGVLNMLVLVVLTVYLALPACLPASQSPVVEVMPKLQLAYLVEDGQYTQPGMATIINTQFNKKSRTEIEARLKRQSVIDPTETQDTQVDVAVVLAEQEQNIDASKTEGSISSSRSVSFSSAIARVLAAAGAKPSIIDPEKRSYGKRRRRSPQIEHVKRKNAHHFGLKAPKVDQVKVKSHGSFGREVHAPVIVVRKDHTNFLNGAKERRKRSDNFIPFSVYDDRRRKTLKIEENDARALPLRLQIEKKEQLARQAKALALKMRSHLRHSEMIMLTCSV